MAAEIASAYVAILPSFRGGSRAIQDQLDQPARRAGVGGGRAYGSGMSEGIGGTAKKIFAPLAAAFAGAKVVDFFKDAIGGASDLNEASTKTQAIFGKATDSVNKFAAGGAKALGQTQLQVLDAAASFGTFGKAAGKTGPDLAKFSTKLVGLSTDLASFYNVDPAQAAEDISAGLRGEAEPLRKYGILLDDASLRAEAMRQGLIKTTKTALTPQNKVLAANALIFRSTKDAQGDFKRTSGGLANQQRILAASFSDLKTNIGKAFLPVIVNVAKFMNDKVVPALYTAKDAVAGLFQRFKDSGGLDKVKAIFVGIGGAAADLFQKFKDGGGIEKLKAVFTGVASAARALGGYVTGTLVPAFQSVIGWVRNNGDVVKTFGVVIGTMVLGWKAWTTAVKLWGAATRIAAAVQATFNAVMALNPIGIIILAIAGLVAGLVYFFTKTKTGQKIWGDFTAFLTSAWEKIKGAFAKGWAAIKDFLGRAWDFIKKVWGYSPYGLIINNWGKIKSYFSGAVDRIKGFFSSAWDLIKKVWNYTPYGIIVSHWGAIKDKFSSFMSSIKGFFQSAWDKIKTVFGYTPYGIIAKNWGKIVGYLKGLPGKVTSALSGLWNGAGSGLRSALNGVIGLWNSLPSFKIPSVKIAGKTIGGGSISLPHVPYLATGGIVTAPTLAMVGEGREAEAVLPLSKLEAMLNGRGGSGVHVTVQGDVLDPWAMAKRLDRTIEDRLAIEGLRGAL